MNYMGDRMSIKFEVFKIFMMLTNAGIVAGVWYGVTH